MKLKLIPILLALFTSISATAQLDSALADSLVRAYIDVYDSTGLFKFKPNTLKPGELFTIYLSYYVDNDNTMELVESHTDNALGLFHNKYQQYYKGILVDGGEMIEHGKDGYLWSVNGKLGHLDQTPDGAMSKEDALTVLAVEYDGWGAGYEWAWLHPDWEQELKDESGNNDTSYFPYVNGQLMWALTNYDNLDFYLPDSYFRLAWRFEIFCLNPYFFEAYYVDAFTGEVFEVEDLLDHNGPADILFYSTVTLDTKSRGWPHNDFVLHEDDNDHNVHTKYYYGDPNTTQNDGGGGTPFSFASEISDGDDQWGTNDQQATSVHWMASQTWDYYDNIHDHEGTKGNGNKIKVRADGPHAFKATNCKGDKLNIGSTPDHEYLGTLDVVAHEYTHCLTDHFANLKNKDEHGALNESFSDIFGVMVERHVESQLSGYTWDWDIGEDSPMSQPIRDVAFPNNGGYHYSAISSDCESNVEFGQPHTYQGDRWYYGDCNGGGVHINNGPHNKWFYLLSEGGTHNGVNVIGVGMENAAEIAFYTLTNLLTRKSEYDDSRAESTYAAELLFGECSLVHQSTSDAWDAVMVPGTPVGCFPQGIETPESRQELTLYPNPAGARITVESMTEIKGQVEIVSPQGSVIISEYVSGAMVMDFNLSIPSGPYFLRFTDEYGNVIVKKIIKL